MIGQIRHGASCGCLVSRQATLSRRRALGFAAGAAVGAALATPSANAAYGESEFMLLSCMDPRLVHDVHEYMEAKKLRGEYSQVALAGGPAAAVAPSFKKWHPAIWENLGATIQLHKIKRVFGMTHRDCGAVKIAYGEAMVANPDVELQTHKAILRAFAAEVKKRHPTLGCETGIMALNGSVEMIG
jgi:carbonic anhydrase